MELSQSHLLAGDEPNLAGVQTTLDAGFGMTLDAQLSISNPFPFGPNPLLEETFDIYSNKASAHETQSDIEYDGIDGFPFDQYSIGGAAQNPSTAQQSCLSAPAVDGSPVTPSTPQSWLQQVASNANGALYPCNVQLCQPSSASSISGTLETCQWNVLEKRLVCTSTGAGCSVCQDTADLCDASGNVYVPVSIQKNYGACNAQ